MFCGVLETADYFKYITEKNLAGALPKYMTTDTENKKNLSIIGIQECLLCVWYSLNKINIIIIA